MPRGHRGPTSPARAAPTWWLPRREVLAVDTHFLDRTQRCYPRIASRLFLNPTRILSDRLQRAPEQLVGERPG